MKDQNTVNVADPARYKIPTLSRWTPEDVALAKALKAFGAITIIKWVSGCVTWEDKNGDGGCIPSTAFSNLQNGRKIPIDTIIKEAEGQHE